MRRFVLKFLLLFIAVTSLAFFSLIGFQTFTMKNEMQEFGPPMSYDMDFDDEGPGKKDPPLIIPFILIVGTSSLFVFFLLRYINSNFVIPLNIIEENLKKIKDGKLDVKFGVKSESQNVIETFNTMNEMVEGLKQKDKLQDNFIQTLTHDLRTPMVAQERALAILQEEFNGHELVEGLAQNTESYLKMINLVMEACTNREIKIDKMEFNLSSLTDTILKSLQPMAAEKNIKLEKDIEGNFTVFADYISFNRIITNLVSNAIENIPEGRQVTLSAKNLDGKTIIAIKDNGDGISKEELDTIFEKYSSKNKGGKKIVSGLGLYIVHELVGKNGGTIKVESEEGKYTKFTIELEEGGKNEEV